MEMRSKDDDKNKMQKKMESWINNYFKKINKEKSSEIMRSSKDER